MYAQKSESLIWGGGRGGRSILSHNVCEWLSEFSSHLVFAAGQTIHVLYSVVCNFFMFSCNKVNVFSLREDYRGNRIWEGGRAKKQLE